MPSLTLKPFGPSGVRVLYSNAAGATLEVQANGEGAWQPHTAFEAPDGVVVVKSLTHGSPRLSA